MKKIITKMNFLALILTIISILCGLVLVALIDSDDFIYNLLYGNLGYYINIARIIFFSMLVSSSLYFLISFIYFVLIMFNKGKTNRMKIFHLIGGIVGIVTVFPFSLFTLQVLNNSFSLNSFDHFEYLLRYYEMFYYGSIILFIFELVTYVINRYYKPKLKSY